VTALALFIVLCSPAEPYDWPLELPRIVTSSFGEYRTGRFHAGIDLRTGGIGKEVRAPQDGYVSRVRCSPWGYGKAVYLTLEDGRTVVFAHLDGFSAPLAEYVRRNQHEKRSYTVDLFPGASQFPFKRGEVVARSGQTGVGVPHLHYEIRDPEGRPVNPRLLGITWPDATRPVIRKVLVMPSGPGSLVNGRPAPAILDVSETAPGEYRCKRITASGAAGFGVDVVDPANQGASVLGVHTLTTTVDGAELFRVANDMISYNTIGSGAVAWHPLLLDKGRFLLQWRWPGNQAPSFSLTKQDGWFVVPQNDVEVRIEAVDSLGNAAAVTVPLSPGGPVELPTFSASSDGRGRVSIEPMGDWLLVTMRFSKPEPAAPELTVSDTGTYDGGLVMRTSADTFMAVYRPSPLTGEVTIRVSHEHITPFEERLAVFRRGEPARTVTFGDLEVTAAPDSPFGTLFLAVEASDEPVKAPVKRLGCCYRLRYAAPVDAALRVSVPMPGAACWPEQVHIYTGSGARWSAGSTERSRDRLTANVGGPGLLVAMEDSVKPRIRQIRPTQAETITSRRPAISARVSDAGSGIREIEAACGGQWLLMEYDPELERIEWERDEDLPAGEQELVFRVTDRAGNETVATGTLRIPGS